MATIIQMSARAFLNKSVKNQEGGWTKGELELAAEASLAPEDNPLEVIQQLVDLLRSKLYENFKVGPNTSTQNTLQVKDSDQQPMADEIRKIIDESIGHPLSKWGQNARKF